MPRLAAELRAAGLSGEELDAKLAALAELDLPEEVLLRLLEPATRADQALVARPHPAIRRKIEIVRHALTRWLRARGFVERTIYAIGWSLALLGPALAHGMTWWGAAGILLVVMIRVRTAAKEFSPKHLPVLRRNHAERQLALEKLIHQIQRWTRVGPSARERADLQRSTLELIASYVRDHRSDLGGRRIFANLLVQDGEVLHVIARSDLLRPVPQAYRPEECTIAWQTIVTAAPQVTGRVYEDAPTTRKGKKYNSILSLPVKLDGRMLGVVSIDSEAMYHFDSYFTELQTELAPYVQLLAITLMSDQAIENTPPPLTEGSHHDHHRQ